MRASTLVPFILALGVGAAMVSPVLAQEQRLVLQLPQALDAARANRDVALAHLNLRAAQADVSAADHAPLPSLTAKLSAIDLQNGVGAGNVLTQKRIDKSIGVDWTWERGNKRALRTEAARGAALAAQADVQDTQLQQQLAALAAFYDLLAAQQRLEQVRHLGDAAAQLATTAQRRVRAGDLAAQDAARAEIEMQRARADQHAAELERQRASLALAALTGIAQDAHALQAGGEWPGVEEVTAPGDWLERVDRRADVRAALARVRAAQSALDGAQALRRSDVTWGASLDHYPGTSTRLLELRMQMPLQWGYGYQGEIGRGLAQLEAARETLEKTRQVALLELQRMQREVQAATERARAYDTDIVPRAQRVADSAELAYGKGALSLTDLLDARRTLRATQLEALAARAEHAKAQGAWQLRTRADAGTP